MNLSQILSIVLLLSIGWILYRHFAPVKGLTELNEQDFSRNMEDSGNKMLIDVREAHEFHQGHIPGATNLPLSRLNDRWSEIPQAKELFLYCQSGARSKRAASVLIRKGYGPVSHLKGGLAVWTGNRSKKVQ
ncbi:rhodanese-like domain-containing protein [Gorillibacterium sp. sgz5001074]|uniref:rhodanese-like domain-containing protein n=1 Tax=Gorillibacterium sp. sgz5001074 TaxID=3446695 RepID=UPI003F679A22